MKLRSRNFTLDEAPRQLANSTILPTMNISPNVVNALAYPFPALTKIIGKPTPMTLKTFTKQVFTNARAIAINMEDITVIWVSSCPPLLSESTVIDSAKYT